LPVPDKMKSVMVTGGTRGVGLGIVSHLAAQGYRAIAVARSRNEAFDATVAAASAGGVGSIEFAPFDLSDTEGLGGLVRDVRREFGALYGLVNNAGLGTHGLLATMSNLDIERLVKLNTLSPLVLTKYVVRHMMADGGGRIINMASIVGSTGYKGLSAYAATKASSIGFTRSLAREVGGLGICVNAVAPGFMATEMTESLGEAEQKKIIGRSALRRLASVEDVAHAVAYLLGPGGRNITGTVITIDAGNTA